MIYISRFQLKTEVYCLNVTIHLWLKIKLKFISSSILSSKFLYNNSLKSLKPASYYLISVKSLLDFRSSGKYYSRLFEYGSSSNEMTSQSDGARKYLGSKFSHRYAARMSRPIRCIEIQHSPNRNRPKFIACIEPSLRRLLKLQCWLRFAGSNDYWA